MSDSILKNVKVYQCESCEEINVVGLDCKCQSGRIKSLQSQLDEARELINSVLNYSCYSDEYNYDLVLSDEWIEKAKKIGGGNVADI